MEPPAAPPSALEPPIPPEPVPRPLPHVGDPALATPSVAPLPIGPRASEAPPAPAPPPSGLAVSSAAVANDAWPIFLDATGAGHRGLCVSREFPDRMRALLGPRDVTVIWLSNTSRPGAVRPVDLNGLGQLVEDAITRETVRAVYLDHVEYLARVNSAAAVRELLERIDRVARAHEARVWVALNPELVTPQTGEILSRGFPSAH